MFWRLDLLPVWGDEQFTLDTSAHPLSQIASIVRGDIHPPLYYFLVHYWLALPWSASWIVKARALSGLWALATTVVLSRLWLNEGERWRFLLLWTLSPCLILYGRMARSYTLQLFLGSLALYWGLKLVQSPQRRGAMLLYAIFGALLFYTHYLPALAIAGAIEIALLYRQMRKGDALVAATAPAAIMLVLYAPWLMSIGSTIERVIHAEPYALTSNPLLEQAIRLVYLGVSFTVGETAPVWVIVCGGALVALLAIKRGPVEKGCQRGAALVALLAAVIGFWGAARWVSFAFIPARLLFLLPFFLMLFARRAWMAVALGCLSVVSLANYYRQQNFLNKGYLLPFDRIADTIQQDGRPAQLIVNAPGLDVSPLVRRLTQNPRPEVIWVLNARGTQAPPPGAQEIRRMQFVPYSDLDHAMMKLLQWPVQPTHVLELTEYQTH